MRNTSRFLAGGVSRWAAIGGGGATRFRSQWLKEQFEMRNHVSTPHLEDTRQGVCLHGSGTILAGL
jgi:hypothetical protein